jgi:hypothetical protein
LTAQGQSAFAQFQLFGFNEVHQTPLVREVDPVVRSPPTLHILNTSLKLRI